MRIVIQDRSRVFRESLAVVLESIAPLRVHATVADDEDLRSVCDGGGVGAVLFEAEDVPWSVSALVSDLRRSMADPMLVGTCQRYGARDQAIPGVLVVTRTVGGEVFAESFLASPERGGWKAARPLSGAMGEPGSLTQREMQVLALISGGSTKSEIAARLGISIKTVENRKQALFAKLGVQSQSHAVAVAFRTGLLRPAPARFGPG